MMSGMDTDEYYEKWHEALARIAELEAEVEKYKWQREIQVVGALDYNGAIARLDALWERHLREQRDA